MTRSRRSEAGESLIETIVTIVVMGLATTALMTGLFVVNRGSALDSRQVNVQAALRAATDEATYKVSNDVRYFTCTLYGVTVTAPTGFTASVAVYSATSVPSNAVPPTTVVTPTFNTVVDDAANCTTQPVKKLVVTVTDTRTNSTGARQVTSIAFARQVAVA